MLEHVQVPHGAGGDCGFDRFTGEGLTGFAAHYEHVPDYFDEKRLREVTIGQQHAQ